MRTRLPRSALLLAMALAVGVLVHVQADLGAQGNARERTVFASAVDDKGNPVDGLGLDDFVVREDGARREVLRVSRAIEPMDIALLVDNGASSEALLPPLREGLTRFVTAMLGTSGAQHNIAIVGLAARPTILVDYTASQKQLHDGIGRLFTTSSSGMTLLDALVEVSRGLERRDTARAVLVPIITDGAEFTNYYYRDVIEAMTRAGAGLHALTVGMFFETDDEALRNRGLVLATGPAATGGQRRLLLSSSAVPQALEQLARELNAQYKVVYGRPESLIPPEKIEVRASRPRITVRAMPARGQKTGA